MKKIHDQYFYYTLARPICTLHLIISVIGLFGVYYYYPYHLVMYTILYTCLGGYFIGTLPGIIYGGHWYSIVADTKISWGYPVPFYGKNQSLMLNNISEFHQKYYCDGRLSIDLYFFKTHNGKKYYIHPKCFGNFNKFVLKIKENNDIPIFFNGKKIP